MKFRRCGPGVEGGREFQNMRTREVGVRTLSHTRSPHVAPTDDVDNDDFGLQKPRLLRLPPRRHRHRSGRQPWAAAPAAAYCSVFQSWCSIHGEFSITRISIVLSRFQHRTISSTFIWYVSICRLSAYSMIGRPLLRRQRQSTSGGTVAVCTSARRALFSLPLARDITRTHMRASLFRARGMPHTLHSVAPRPRR